MSEQQENIPIPKFTIGDRVIPKKIGVPAVGVVGAIYAPGVYTYINGISASTALLAWQSIYDNAFNECIYSLIFEKPIKHYSLEIYKHLMRDVLTEQECEDTYDINVPMCNLMQYPEADLELL